MWTRWGQLHETYLSASPSSTQNQLVQEGIVLLGTTCRKVSLLDVYACCVLPLLNMALLQPPVSTISFRNAALSGCLAGFSTIITGPGNAGRNRLTYSSDRSLHVVIWAVDLLLGSLTMEG